MNDKKNAGYIIIVVTIILVALTLLGMVFLNLTSIDFSATSNYRNSLQAEMVARAGLDYAIYVLNMDKYGTDSVVYNNNAYHYIGTTTLGYDESYDANTEEWLGTGTGKIFGTSTALTIANAIDNNGAGTVTSPWLDMPCTLDRGLRAQYAILIEDVGESRININATGNIGTASGSFVYGTGATTYDIRLQDILGATAATNIILGTTSARCIHGSPGTDASHYLPRNPTGTDSPFNVLDAADICFGTYTQPGTYKSRLRNIINNEASFLNARRNLTVYSFDTLIADNGVGNLLLSDNKNYYRLKLDNSAGAGSITAQMQIAGFSQGTATQLAVHVKDYLDTDTDITAYGTPAKYGLEPHPFINELYHTGTHSTQPRQSLVELYNPFDMAIGSSTMSINGSTMELVLKTTKTQYRRLTGCTWTTGTVTTTLSPIGTASFSIQSKEYATLGYGTQNTAVSLSGTQTVTGFDIYDYDSKSIPMAVTVTLMGSSSALSGGNYLILDEVQPNAYTNSIRGEDCLWLLYQLIEYIYEKTHAVGNTSQETQAFQSLLNRSGEGLWDGSLGTLEVDHTSSQTGNNALERLTEHTTLLGVQGGPQVWIVTWDPESDGVSDAITELTSLISATSGNAQINADVETVIIDYAQEVIDLLNNMLCAGTLNVRASIGERKNPLIERSDNWGMATTHTLGQVNYSYGSVSTNQRKQLVVANKNMISLGELGHLLTVGYGTQSSYTGNALYATSGTGTVDSAKLDLQKSPATLIPNYFTILDPQNDAIDDDADGAIGTDTGLQADDIDGPEIQVPGRININTASSSVLAALPGTSASVSLGSWSATIQGTKTAEYSLISKIINARPLSSVGTVTTVAGMDYFGTDNIDNDGDGLIDEKDEKDLIYTAISNLITTHSNVFAVYVTARIVNSDATQTFATRKLAAIVDRSVTPVKIRYFRWVTEW